jgi:Transposase DDE domain
MKKHSHRIKSSPKNKLSKTRTAPACSVPSLALSLQQQLDKLPLKPLTRASGFRRRQPKKLTPRLFVQAACLLVTLGSVSYRRWAGLIGVLGRCTLTKQSLFERMSPKAVGFLQAVLEALLGTLATAPTSVPAALQGFGRVLVQDSTTLQLPEKLTRFFPGASNQKGAQGALLKIQACYDLLSQSFVCFSLSSYRRNDQAASPEVLPLVRAGDLILRDLGCFVLEVFQQIALANAFFLSRLRVGVRLWEADGGTPVNLLRRLRSCPGHFEGQFCLGKEKLLVRVVAIRMPAQVAAQRRRKARQNRDRRSAPSAQRLALLGWAIFITNVPATRLSAKAVAAVYGLRWRIETIFKAWKSYFALTEVPASSKSQVEALIYAKLIFITLFQVCFWQRWGGGKDAQGRPALSLLKVAQAVESYLLVLVLSSLGVDLALAWEQLLNTHCRYECRRRRYFMQDVQGKGGTVLAPKVK